MINQQSRSLWAAFLRLYCEKRTPFGVLNSKPDNNCRSTRESEAVSHSEIGFP